MPTPVDPLLSIIIVMRPRSLRTEWRDQLVPLVPLVPAVPAVLQPFFGPGCGREYPPCSTSSWLGSSPDGVSIIWRTSESSTYVGIGFSLLSSRDCKSTRTLPQDPGWSKCPFIPRVQLRQGIRTMISFSLISSPPLFPSRMVLNTFGPFVPILPLPTLGPSDPETLGR